MKLQRVMTVVVAAVVVGVAGCSGDMGEQIVKNEQVRTQAMNAIASHTDLSMQMLDKLMASDSLRVQVVDHMLQNENGAKQVLFRIATSPQAVEMVLGLAVRDSAMRGHVVALVHGMEMGAAGRK